MGILSWLRPARPAPVDASDEASRPIVSETPIATAREVEPSPAQPPEADAVEALAVIPEALPLAALTEPPSPYVPFTLPDGRPYKLGVPVSGHVDDAYLGAVRAGHFQDDTWQFFMRWVRAGDTFLDLGSSLGVYTIPAATLGAQVHAFELIDANASRLADTVVENGLRNVMVNLGAVSDTLGVVGFKHGHSAWAMVSDEAVLSVASIVVDHYVRQRGIARVDVMKIDVEGSERAALRGARELIERDHPDIVIESNVFTCGTAGYSYREPLAFLAERGYGIYRFLGDRLAPWGADEAQEVICTDYFCSTKPVEEIAARSGWRIEPMRDEERIASILEQGGITPRHSGHVLAVADRLPPAVRDEPRVAAALAAWKNEPDAELMALLRTGAR